MKNVFIALLFVAFISCNRKQCWTCKYTVTKTDNGNTSKQEYSQDICDKTRSEIKQLEAGNGYSEVAGSIKYEYSATKCNQGNPFK